MNRGLDDFIDEEKRITSYICGMRHRCNQPPNL